MASAFWHYLLWTWSLVKKHKPHSEAPEVTKTPFKMSRVSPSMCSQLHTQVQTGFAQFHAPVESPGYNRWNNRLTHHFLSRYPGEGGLGAVAIHANRRLFCGQRNRDENTYQKKKIIFSLTVEGSEFPREKHWRQRALHSKAFVILWLLICQLSACFKGTRAIMFSSVPFQSWWPKFA